MTFPGAPKHQPSQRRNAAKNWKTNKKVVKIIDLELEKKSAEQILVKWMDILARTLVICHSFYYQQLPRYRKMFSVILVFEMEKFPLLWDICIPSQIKMLCIILSCVLLLRRN